ncbi:MULTISPECIES: low temperature requirement protein A [unclassified Pseudonocardia]|uniref:low temperature requirement protein A n=1 Tax=unclassified Pseudonocardia TaxID=2619320 RepID=UPI0001FFED46|nr:low temperature requirement protein A [Pseudonocardia sp. Ae707_Ps1]
MSTPSLGLSRMHPRDPDEPHRVASPLELFFDLVFVVAVSLSSAELHHAESGGHVGAGLGGYLIVFFAVWWAWMNFTWFASAFDVDDWLYRVLTFVQMAGALVLAAGTPAAMAGSDFTVTVAGYLIMRLAMVTQWLRAAGSHPGLRTTALRYAGGITGVQVLWVLWVVWSPTGATGVVTFVVLALAELSVPVLAERARSTPWHPHHIAERYSLFTLILLGESILASTGAVVDALSSAEHLAPLLELSACGLVLAAGMWWIYFCREQHEHVRFMPRALVFGYGHYLIFAAAGAFSAGIEVAVDVDTRQTGLAAAAAGATLTVPVAVFVLGIWALSIRPTLRTGRNAVVAGLAVLLGLSAFAPWTPVVAAALMVAVVVAVETAQARNTADA